MLMYVFRSRDETGEGFSRMDDIREVYQQYSGGLIEKNAIDAVLSKCNVQVMRRGQVKYQ